jgi:hypothetical protein
MLSVNTEPPALEHEFWQQKYLFGVPGEFTQALFCVLKAENMANFEKYGIFEKPFRRRVVSGIQG